MNFNEVVNKGWDIKPPSRDYFIELKRVSKNGNEMETSQVVSMPQAPFSINKVQTNGT